MLRGPQSVRAGHCTKLRSSHLSTFLSLCPFFRKSNHAQNLPAAFLLALTTFLGHVCRVLNHSLWLPRKVPPASENG